MQKQNIGSSKRKGQRDFNKLSGYFSIPQADIYLGLTIF